MSTFVRECDAEETLALKVESSDEELIVQSFPSTRSKPSRTFCLGIALLGSLVGALLVVREARITTSHPTSNQGHSVSSQPLEAEIVDEPTPISKFMTGRRLAQVGAFSFDTKCPIDQPICTPDAVFAIHMQEGLKTIKKMLPDVYDLLNQRNLTLGQQDFLLKVLSLLKSPEVIEQGQLIHDIVKQHPKAGNTFIHAEVLKALLAYGEKNGTVGLPSMIASSPAGTSVPRYDLLRYGNSSGVASRRRLHWEDDSIKDAVNWSIPHDPKAPEQSKAVTSGIYAGFIISWILLAPIGITWLILEILHYLYIINVPLGIRRSMIKLSGVLGSFCFAAFPSCPVFFLGYWLAVWLNFGRSPGKIAEAEMRHIPWDFMMKKLPGLAAPDQGRNLLAADARMAG